MKKLALTFFLFSVLAVSWGNPIVSKAWISEILVDSAGNWTIEIGFNEYSYSEIDSIRLVTSSGSSIISYYEVIYNGNYDPFDSLAIITLANLAVPVPINPDGDFVRLVSYIWGYEELDEVAFGDYAGSYLDCIQTGESVSCNDLMDFCIDSSPTIGEGNSEGGGRTGNFSGMILDPSGYPITNGFIYIVNNAVITLYPDSLGFFDQDILSRRYTFDTIQHYLPPWPYNVYTYVVEPVDFCLRPDLAQYQDIIATSLVMGVEDNKTKDENAVTIAPNPFFDKVIFYFNLKTTHSLDEISISIFSIDGRKIDRIFLEPGQIRYEWNPGGSVSPGTLIYRLEKNNSVIKTGKFVRL